MWVATNVDSSESFFTIKLNLTNHIVPTLILFHALLDHYESFHLLDRIL